MTSTEQSPVTSAQSSTSDLGPATTPQLSPVRKEPHYSLPKHCPSVSSVETRKISQLWQRVAKHCKIEKVLKMSSTTHRKYKRESVASSNVSTNGTISTQLSETSFEALERDSESFLQAPKGQRVPMDATQLLLIHPSKTGYYTAYDPVPPQVQHSIGGEVNTLGNSLRCSSTAYEDLTGSNPRERDPIISAFAPEEPMDDEVGTGKPQAEAQAKNEDIANSEVFAMLKDMKEEYTSLKLQMQIIQKTIQKLGSNPPASVLSSLFLQLGNVGADMNFTGNVHFACDVGMDVGHRARDSLQVASATSKRVQPLNDSKNLIGPRDMVSLSSRSSILRSRSQSRAYSHNHQRKGKSECIQGPKIKDRHSKSSSTYSLSSFESISASNTPEALHDWRSPEVPDHATDSPPSSQITMVDHHSGCPSSAESLPIPTLKQHKRATKRFGTTKETQKAQFTPATKPLKRRESTISATKQLRKLPQTPPQLPTPGTSPVLSRSILPPTTCLSKQSRSPGALTDNEFSVSSFNNECFISASKIEFGPEVSACYPDTEVNTAPFSARSTPRSSAELSSQRRHPGRAALPTKIQEDSVIAVRDLEEVPPEPVLQIKECLLRDLRTKSNSMYDAVYDGLERSSMANMLEEALSQLRAKEEELKCLKGSHAEVLRHQAKELAKLEQENDELQLTIMEQEERIYNITGPTVAAELSTELPEYTPTPSSTLE